MPEGEKQKSSAETTVYELCFLKCSVHISSFLDALGELTVYTNDSNKVIFGHCLQKPQSCSGYQWKTNNLWKQYLFKN